MMKRQNQTGFRAARSARRSGSYTSRLLRLSLGLIVATLFCQAAAMALAQGISLDGQSGLSASDGFGAGLGGGKSASEGDLKIHASILPPVAGHAAQLSIAVDIPAGWHTYSITQPPGGPI